MHALMNITLCEKIKINRMWKLTSARARNIDELFFCIALSFIFFMRGDLDPTNGLKSVDIGGGQQRGEFKILM